jgi:hypothetical protein
MLGDMNRDIDSDRDATPAEQLIRRLIAADVEAVRVLVEQAETSDVPAVLTAAALVVPSWRPLLTRAAATAETTRDRQLVAIAAAHLDGDTGRALVLARDHLAAYPNSLLVAHIAAASTNSEREPTP